MDVSREVSLFVAEHPSLPPKTVACLSNGSNQEFLDEVARLTLRLEFAQDVFCYFEPIFPEIFSRLEKFGNLESLVSISGYYAFAAAYLPEVILEVLERRTESHDLLAVVDSLSFAELSSLLLGLWRLLRTDNTAFGRFIRPARLHLLLHHKEKSVRYLAARLLCLYLHASDAAFHAIISKHDATGRIPGPFDGISIDYAFLHLWEQKRQADFCAMLKSFQTRGVTDASCATLRRAVDESDLSPAVVNIAGILMIASRQSSPGRQGVSRMTMTDTTIENLRALAKAFLEPRHVLVSGIAGCGKSLSINHLAAKLGKADKMITLHLNEQSDAKSLLGIYTTGDQPGSFQWQPGVLTTAVREGRWVLIEDLDRVPNEVLSVLVPLLKRGELRVPGQESSIKAAAGFKLVATTRTHTAPQSRTRLKLSRTLASHCWLNVDLRPLAPEQLRSIILDRFPVLSSCMDRILGVYERLQMETRKVRANERDRPFSSRDLLKWCSRMDRGFSRPNGKIPEISDNILDGFFLDALDCFLGSKSQAASTYSKLVSSIAEELRIAPERKEFLVQHRVPTVESRAGDRATFVTTGRAQLMGNALPRLKTARKQAPLYALNTQSCRIIEQIGVAINGGEPLLLVGETGIGKTTAVQHLASLMQQPLLAINLSQQSEVSDLVGGYKPVNIRSFIVPLKDEFDHLFEHTFSQKRNIEFKEMLAKFIAKSQWKRAVRLWKEALKLVDKNLGLWPSAEGEAMKLDAKRRKLADGSYAVVKEQWIAFAEKVDAIERRLSASGDSFAFSFVEGKLVKAVRDGTWVLLDEINLATPDTLECLSDLLDAGLNGRPSILLTEAGLTERIEAHPNFRLIGAMNPSTDIGKRDLPLGIRSRFTELYVDSPDRQLKDLEILVQTYLCHSSPTVPQRKICARVASLYIEIQALVQQGRLEDGSGQRPQYSLRSLTRSLQHAAAVGSDTNLKRSLYEGISMCFSTALGTDSFEILDRLIKSNIFQDLKSADVELRKPVQPAHDQRDWVSLKIRVHATTVGTKSREESHWLPKGNGPIENPAHYIITPYIARNLRNLIRATSTRRYPVLIQGPTSAGKTSMVEYLATRSGNKFVRINNHEHTDLQEYLGSYVSTPTGGVVFQEGVLVQALREGYWVVLDELNLAPTDVLEALNRLLDDNRELFIPETQETVRPHPNFMLFATQNPVGAYGGRKVLSRAFRNRFLELHFDDIPVSELNVILASRCDLPESWCRLIIEVYTKLSQRRQESRLFEQNSFATLRDLFRWAFRGGDTVEDLGRNGYLLLGEKVRKQEERTFVRSTIEQVMNRKGVKLDVTDESLYSGVPKAFADSNAPELKSIVWTKAMRRLCTLVIAAVNHNEPVLLIGETGGGKTTICQMLAAASGKTLRTVNAHQNMETGDIIGAQRPLRNRVLMEAELIKILERSFAYVKTPYSGPENGPAMLSAFDKLDSDARNLIPDSLRQDVEALRANSRALFEWHDGSLVQSMREGSFFLLDEISLADDSVLERMNSVLDPQRSLLLAEKGTQDSVVHAEDGFQFFATMNPGGDFGKKELSPALRNRFTEIWVPPMDDAHDILQIIQSKLDADFVEFSKAMVQYASWFNKQYHSAKNSSISIRDVLAWVNFVNLKSPTSVLKNKDALIQGAMMVFSDTLGANPSGIVSLAGLNLAEERQRSHAQLLISFGDDAMSPRQLHSDIKSANGIFSIGSFGIFSQGSGEKMDQFHFETETTRLNAERILRGLQTSKPILVEGAPGVGKTSLISALATATGHSLTRINLSDQTDLMDLFGSDAPVEDAEPGIFAWRDAPFLRAMKNGDWVLLDEMNLASQPILEGLNACIDHRGEIFIPELGRTFYKHPDFRLFAAQNPQQQGGGRKGLPMSFVNRFTVVFADSLRTTDLETICSKNFPGVSPDLIRKLVRFISELSLQLESRSGGFGSRGSPWEINLRDALRCLSLLGSSEALSPSAEIRDIVNVIFTQRFRTPGDQVAVEKLATNCFGERSYSPSLYFNLTPQELQVGHGLLKRSPQSSQNAKDEVPISTAQFQTLESVILGVQQKLPVILVGPPEAGKTSLLETLASIAGVKLEVLAVNSDIDASDLIGAYEQADPLRHMRSLFNSITDTSSKFIVQAMSSASDEAFQNLLSSLFSLLRMINGEHPERHTASKVMSILADVLLLLEENDSLHQFSPCKDLYSDMSCFKTKCHELTNKALQPLAAKFEWVDSVLVTAVERGHWLVLENANLCSSSVLDRLNSLLEDKGVLIINENCAHDGTAKVIKPHPDFRIFMTLDPQHGEISRAMRNRGLELFLNPSVVPGVNARVSLDSSLMRYQQFWSHPESAQTGQPDMSLLCSFQYLSITDFEMLGAFREQAQLGLMSQAKSRGLERVLRGYSLMAQHEFSCLQETKSYYESVDSIADSGDQFVKNQPIFPLINQPLALIKGSAACQAGLVPLGELHDACLDIVSIEALWHDVLESTDALATDSRLQKSLIAMRSTKREAVSYAQLPSVLTRLKDLLLAMLKETHLPAKIIPVEITTARELAYIWNALFRHSNVETYDDLSYKAFLVALSSHMRQLCSSYLINEAMHHSFASEIESLLPSAQMRSGFGMLQIWKAFKSPSARSLDIIDQLVKLGNTASQFDSVAHSFVPPVEDTARLRANLLALGAASFSRTSGDKLPLEAIQSAIQRGSIPESQRAMLAVSPFYGDCFAAINRVRWLHQDDSYQAAEVLGLASTQISLRADTFSSLTSSGRALLKHFGSKKMEAPSFVLGTDLLELIMKRSSAVDDVPLNAVDLLESELTHLGCFVAASSPILFDDQRQDLENLLCKPMNRVIESLGDFNSTTHGDGTRTKDVADVFETYFRPRMEMSRRSGDESSTSWVDLALRFLMVGIGCLKLFVPSDMTDPAQLVAFERKLHSQRREDLTGKRDAMSAAEHSRTGLRTNLRTQLIEEQILSLPQPPAEAEVPRPAHSQMRKLQGVLSSVLRVLERCERNLSMGGEAGSKYPDIAKDIANLTGQLSEDFYAYEDLTGPVIEFLLILRAGCLLYSRFSTNDAHLRLPPAPSLPLHLFDTSLRQWHDCSQLLSRLSRIDMDTEGIPLLKSFAARAKFSPSSRWTHSTKECLIRIIEDQYRIWKKRSALEEKNAIQSSRLYHYRGGADEEDDEYQQEFISLFPGQDDDDGIESLPSSTAKTPREDLQAFTSAVASVHMDLFSPRDTSQPSFAELLDDASDNVASENDVGSSGQSSRAPRQFASIILRLRQKLNALRSGEQGPKVKNIYYESSLLESLRLRDIVKKVHARVEEIRDTWPEHATLQHIIEVCEQLMRFRHSEPLVKFLTKTEQLNAYLAEWQSVASRDYSVASQYKSVTDLLIAWRRLELSTWAQLLDQEDLKADENARSWWFVAYENLIAMPMRLNPNTVDIASHSLEIIRALDGLLRNSTLGQFQTRLRIIASLQAQMPLLSGKRIFNSLSSALNNFISHFSRFSQRIQAAILEKRKTLEKQVRDVIQLASWKDTNITSLRQSAKASHRKLFNVVRKYRESLRQPVASLLVSIEPFVSAAPDSSRLIRPASCVNPAALAECQARLDEWERRPSRYQNPNATAKAMERILPVQESDGARTLQLHSFVATLEASFKQLSTATPSILTEDNNSAVKHLLSRKRRLFADTLKEVRQMGFKPSQTPAVLSSQSSLAMVIATGPDFSIEWQGSEEVNQTFCASLDAMDQARLMVNDHHEDLTLNDIKRSLGQCEGMLAMSIEQRRALSKSSLGVEQMQGILNKIHAVCGDRASLVHSSANATRLGDNAAVLTWLPAIISASHETLAAQAQLGQLDWTSILDSLQAFSKGFKDSQTRLAGAPKLPDGLITRSDSELAAHISAQIGNFEYSIRDMTDTAPQTKPLLEHLLLWTSFERQRGEDLRSAENISSFALDTFNKRLYSALDILLSTAQDVAQVFQSHVEGDGDTDWLVKLSLTFERSIAAFQVDRIKTEMTNVLESLAHVGDSELSAACASLESAVPIISQYKVSLEKTLDSLYSLHKALTHMHYKLTTMFCLVATQGFCKPAEKSEKSRKGDEKLESGTGLGEGDGEEDISKDIADDEDLSELAQDPQNANKEGDEPENRQETDAVDIADELHGGNAGENEELEENDEKPQKKDDEGEEGDVGDGPGDDEEGAQVENDESTQKDEGIGDVDDAEPSALDEKFWDQAGDEEKREKEGKRSASNKGKDDQAAAQEKPGNDSDQENGSNDASGGSDNSDDEDDAASVEDGEQNGVDREVMDPHVPPADELELSEDLNLDGDKKSHDKDDDSADDLDMDMDGSDESAAGEERGPEKGEGEEESNDHAAEEDISASDIKDEMDLDDEADIPEEAQEGHDDSIKPYASEQQGNQDMDPSGTAQATVGTEMMSGTGQNNDQDLAADDQEDKDVAIEQDDRPVPENRSQPGSGGPEGGSGAKPSQMSTSQNPQQEAMKKLGDVLEKWHRQHRQINESVSQYDEGQAQQRDVDVADAEFEHLPDDDAQADTQALGAANEDQARALDDRLAIPDTGEGKQDQSQTDNFLPDAEDADRDSEENDVDMEDMLQGNTENEPDSTTRATSMVGERSAANTRSGDWKAEGTDDERESLSDFNEDFETMQLEQANHADNTGRSNAAGVWSSLEGATQPLALILTEQLRLVLTPTQATKLRGDFRTGKRLNLKRIIPYIASSYRRDKIWLRRSVPSKRQYQIQLAIDDSKSMGENGSAELAFACLALVSRSLTMLESGELGVVGFGADMFVAHELGMPFSGEAGARTLSRFGFAQTTTDVRRMVARSVEVFREARLRSQSAADLWQLQMIISDGICEDHGGIRKLLLEAQEERIMFVFIVVDAGAQKSAASAGKSSQSIVDLERVEFVEGPKAEDGGAGEMKLVRKRYLDTFPFKYFLVVRDVRDLPDVLAGALRSWFAEVVDT